LSSIGILWSFIIYLFSFKPGSHAHRVKRETEELKICQIYAVADYRYFQDAGNNDVFTTANHIVSLWTVYTYLF